MRMCWGNAAIWKQKILLDYDTSGKVMSQHTVISHWSLTSFPPTNTKLCSLLKAAPNTVSGQRWVVSVSTWSYLSEEYAELFERLEQRGISNLLDDKDTFWWLVPRQSLAGRVLNVPEHTNTTFTSGGQNGLSSHLIRIPLYISTDLSLEPVNYLKHPTLHHNQDRLGAIQLESPA